MSTIAKLERTKRLERVEKDPEQVRALRQAAARHMSSSQVIAESDVAGAFSLAYDAARKAMTALILHHGYRTRGGGAHMTTGEAAAILVPGIDVDGFEWMRLTRNATEYGSDKHPSATMADLDEAWEVAGEIIDSVEAAFGD